MGTSRLLPHDTGYVDAYAHAWSRDPEQLIQFFAPNGTYTDVAMGATYAGKEGILRFHRWMLKFAPDSLIVFYDAAVQDGLAYMEWSWSGSITGPLQLPGGGFVDAAGKKFDITGIAKCTFDSEGMLTSHRDYWDVGLLVAQLGQRLDVASPSA